ncbi:hypothetical protein, partial [Vibrio parahaemolyticus]|uniref:hypothetical protein n=1 Tax=Vibrio parahaemolyticus TaxID=670 RepID=UPI00116CD889
IAILSNNRADFNIYIHNCVKVPNMIMATKNKTLSSTIPDKFSVSGKKMSSVAATNIPIAKKNNIVDK